MTFLYLINQQKFISKIKWLYILWMEITIPGSGSEVSNEYFIFLLLDDMLEFIEEDRFHFVVLHGYIYIYKYTLRLMMLENWKCLSSSRAPCIRA
jgi:hypothetical protein